ncbi:protein PBDC1 [Procambarus clarkii]|uniref:protein PBDC1 n=1 Tax=Procambarus clarkii TaxID=6728 RepID=UPI0037422628
MAEARAAVSMNDSADASFEGFPSDSVDLRELMDRLNKLVLIQSQRRKNIGDLQEESEFVESKVKSCEQCPQVIPDTLVSVESTVEGSSGGKEDQELHQGKERSNKLTSEVLLKKMPTQAEIFAELGIPGGVEASAGVGGGAAINAEELGNDSTMEELWAMKAMEHSEIHFNLLCAVDPKLLRLTPKDDVIYSAFRKEFPDFNVAKLEEKDLKSSEAKEKWRPFCIAFEKEIEDYSFATLVRIDTNDEYSESNTILVTRIQFFCIEIARNREGLNDAIRTQFKPKPRSKKTQQ